MVFVYAPLWLLHHFDSIGAWHSGGIKVRYTSWIVGLRLLLPGCKPFLNARALWSIRVLVAWFVFKFACRYGLYVFSHKDHCIIFSAAALLRSDLYSAFARGRPEGAMRALLCAGFVWVNELLLLFQCICHLVKVCGGASHHGLSTGMPRHVLSLWYYVISAYISEAVTRGIITLKVSSWGYRLLGDHSVLARARLELLTHDEHVLLEGSLLLNHVRIKNNACVWNIDRGRLPITLTLN